MIKCSQLKYYTPITCFPNQLLAQTCHQIELDTEIKCTRNVKKIIKPKKNGSMKIILTRENTMNVFQLCPQYKTTELILTVAYSCNWICTV